MMGMRVIAIDRGAEKRKLCEESGAEVYLDLAQVEDLAGEVMRITTYGAHAVIVFSASPEGFAVAPSMCRPGGTIVSVGLPTTTVAWATPGVLARRRLNIVGSITGTLVVSGSPMAVAASLTLVLGDQRGYGLHC